LSLQLGRQDSNLQHPG